MTRVLVHGTAVQISGQGVLIFGPSGAGKSDLALRLIGEGALLVADDQTWMSARAGQILAEAPTTIAGKMEARGVGVVAVPHTPAAIVRLAVELIAQRPDRIPEPAYWAPPGLLAAPPLPLLRLMPFEASATVKLRLALAGKPPV